ncbi:hypothetical protein ACLB0R_00700 [Sphingomonas sp. GlSt437]|uniref:hypothetical protein n=1 Tax=Sphingomonas sp. GlSt437 TaxID=3389970 RepID=UPI003A83A6F2
MKIMISGALVATLLPLSAADVPSTAFHVGETYEIDLFRDSASEGPNGSTGSSHDQDAIVERIDLIRPDGVEAVFDLPSTATAEDRRQNWQFPAQIFLPFEGQAKLLNAPELEKQVDKWLK